MALLFILNHHNKPSHAVNTVTEELPDLVVFFLSPESKERRPRSQASNESFTLDGQSRGSFMKLDGRIK